VYAPLDLLFAVCVRPAEPFLLLCAYVPPSALTVCDSHVHATLAQWIRAIDCRSIGHRFDYGRLLTF
jgi:hypothetical protein